MPTERGSTFDCPHCDATAPSTAMPYDALGYAVCPVCSYTGGPDASTDSADRRGTPVGRGSGSGRRR